MENEIDIIFPDGGKKSFPKGISGKYIAEDISKSLAKKAIAIKVNGVLKTGQGRKICFHADEHMLTR